MHLKYMKIVYILNELNRRNKSINGNKKVLYNQMVQTVNCGAPLVSNLAQETPKMFSGDTFPPEAHWKDMVLGGEPLDESFEEVDRERFKDPTVTVNNYDYQ